MVIDALVGEDDFKITVAVQIGDGDGLRGLAGQIRAAGRVEAIAAAPTDVTIKVGFVSVESVDQNQVDVPIEVKVGGGSSDRTVRR